MFYVKEVANDNGLIPIMNGITFFTLGENVNFELGFKDNAFEPTVVSFTSMDDKSRSKLEIKTGELVDRKLQVIFYNPSIGSSGFAEPMGILQNEKFRICMMIHVERFNKSETCRLTYGFMFEEIGKEGQNG